MGKIRLLLTSVGGLVVPNMIKSLKENTGDDFYIVGVDMRSDAVGFHFADKSYVVPPGNSEEYTGQLLNIAKKEHIDVILPLSDEELLAFSKNKSDFEKEGIIAACSKYETVETATDKATMLQFLEKRGVPVPEYQIPHSIHELETAVKNLGYPEKPVVFKPRRSRGARGFWLLRADLDKRYAILSSRERQEITLDWLLEALDDGKPFPEVLVEEYLPGEDFNVDVLAWRGESLHIIPNQRLVPNAGPVQVGLVKEDKKVRDMVEKVVEVFGFDYYVNVELAYAESPKSLPLVYEINPRVSAPILVNKAAGVNLLKLGIKMVLGQTIPKHLPIRETKMIRYWNELYLKGERHFAS